MTPVFYLLNLPMKQHWFIREDSSWFIDLPEYIARGGSKADLEMISGAHKMRDILPAGKMK
jgi:hypothetical protein